MSVEASRDVLTRTPPEVSRRVAYGSESWQFGDLRLPSGTGPFPTAVVIHGGFWRMQFDLEHIGHLCAALTGAGLATWSLEYRRTAAAGDDWQGTLRDVAAGTAHLAQLAKQYPLDMQHVVAVGHSAGGHLALWLAAHNARPVAEVDGVAVPFELLGAVSLAGVADLRMAAEMRLGDGAVHAFLGGSPAEFPERYLAASPRERLPLGIRQVLVHGTDDQHVPIGLARAYCAAAVTHGDDVTLSVLPHTGHFELIDPLSHAWPPVLAAVVGALQT